MCGISALLECENIPELPDWDLRPNAAETKGSLPTITQLRTVIQRRGPDLFDEKDYFVDGASIKLIGASLCLRGEKTRQPICLPTSDDSLLFNGEIYSGLPSMGPDENDGMALAKTLEETNDGEGISEVLDALYGPWSIIYWCSSEKRLYFGKDRLGRRSLLLKVTPGKGLCISSVAVSGEHERVGFREVPPGRLFYAQLSEDSTFSFGALSQKPAFMKLEISEQFSIGETSLARKLAARLFVAHFREALTRRLVCNDTMSVTPRFAVLFSGGVDSLFLARILDMVLPASEPVELVNVAFGRDSKAFASCPDRIAAIESLAELSNLSQSNRVFHFLEVNVGPVEADFILDEYVKSLVYPRSELMDNSIGTALWACAGGAGHLAGTWDFTERREQLQKLVEEAVENSQMISRILLSGLGVDEMMGGYKGRHRTKLKFAGAKGLQKELQKDLSELWWRNLGRDDRIVSSHGRELRHPFLDEDVVSFVMSLPLSLVCNLSEKDGKGDKALLRTAAREVGLSMRSCSRSKRAMQFGSRSKHLLERVYAPTQYNPVGHRKPKRR